MPAVSCAASTRYAVNTLQAINVDTDTRSIATTTDYHTSAVHPAAEAASRRSPHPICTRQRPKGQIRPFSVHAQAATTCPSMQRDGLVVDQVYDAGADADALAPPDPRWRRARRADIVAMGRKGQI